MVLLSMVFTNKRILSVPTLWRTVKVAPLRQLNTWSGACVAALGAPMGRLSGAATVGVGVADVDVETGLVGGTSCQCQCAGDETQNTFLHDDFPFV